MMKLIANLPENDWRKHAPDFNEPKLSSHLILAKRLQFIGTHHDCSPGAVAVAWTLLHPAVTAAIAGAPLPSRSENFWRASTAFGRLASRSAPSKRMRCAVPFPVTAPWPVAEPSAKPAERWSITTSDARTGAENASRSTGKPW